MCITSCALTHFNVIVCGKWSWDRKGDSLIRYITLYDKQWKGITDISIPRNNNNSDHTSVYVDVDRDGMILAAPYGQSDIYVINPADGKIANTPLRCREKWW